ncbi:uncharacterized protein LOC104438542 [Eucalyptus grandis]|uniref:uncharacterized protein LOC104438542 n=1 Tax=Eucalyptus grandis TaxID=71139 RepID=UPI00192ECC09|nr:uncharacterized protein LOC104438542 [Eucalyptus grandis]
MNLIPSSERASLATAMAVWGTFILFAIGFQKSYSTTRVIIDHITEFSDLDIPSCTISGAAKKKKIKREKARKTARFEEHVADPDCYDEEFKFIAMEMIITMMKIAIIVLRHPQRIKARPSSEECQRTEQHFTKQFSAIASVTDWPVVIDKLLLYLHVN